MKKVLLVIGIILLIPVGWFSIHFATGIYRSFFNPYLERQISGPVMVSSDWLVISPKEPLTADRQIQYIILVFTESGIPEVGQRGIRMPDGTIAIPEVELIDDKHNIFPLKAVAFGETGVSFSSEQDLPKDRSYRTVRIKANKTLRLSSIYWKCWNQWDVS